MSQNLSEFQQKFTRLLLSNEARLYQLKFCNESRDQITKKE